MSAMGEAIVKRAADQSRLAFDLALAGMAGGDETIVAISADSVGLMGLDDFIKNFPERFVDVGIAEQNAMGIASGLATTGLRPFLCGYAPFITARSMEQLRNDVAYANQRVVIGAAASGISLCVSGGTHHALEDLALMRAFPNMTAIVPADAVFRVGRADCLRPGTDVTIIACGCLVVEAVAAAETLSGQGVAARVLNLHTLKPLDRDAILAAAAETRAIVTAEEHRVTGGLGGAVAELLARENPTPMRMVGMPDEFAVVGPTAKVREGYGMSAANIVMNCLELLD